MISSYRGRQFHLLCRMRDSIWRNITYSQLEQMPRSLCTRYRWIRGLRLRKITITSENLVRIFTKIKRWRFRNNSSSGRHNPKRFFSRFQLSYRCEILVECRCDQIRNGKLYNKTFALRFSFWPWEKELRFLISCVFGFLIFDFSLSVEAWGVSECLTTLKKILDCKSCYKKKIKIKRKQSLKRDRNHLRTVFLRKLVMKMNRTPNRRRSENFLVGKGYYSEFEDPQKFEQSNSERKTSCNFYNFADKWSICQQGDRFGILEGCHLLSERPCCLGQVSSATQCSTACYF